MRAKPEQRSSTADTLKVTLIGFFGALILRAVNATLRWEYVGLDGNERWWADREPCILLFWHGRQLFMPWIYLRHRKSKDAPAMTALISEHNDGRMIAMGMRFLGINSVAGSSSRGGLRALHALIDRLRNNSHIAITPDGPKGPAQKLKNGAIIIAQRSGATVYPSAFSAQRYWKFGSWCGMIFPKPFSKAVMIKGAPIVVAETENQEQLAAVSQSVEAALEAVTVQADNYFLAR